ncbi:MAG: hypothetical protein A9Z00_13030 [Thermobacillus sp. ZCTH02-B1]|nr:MAG: hypothetical protein A9Z00_13030 [Thermobacillus sp. ZCTH02-B1]
MHICKLFTGRYCSRDDKRPLAGMTGSGRVIRSRLIAFGRIVPQSVHRMGQIFRRAAENGIRKCAIWPTLTSP